MTLCSVVFTFVFICHRVLAAGNLNAELIVLPPLVLNYEELAGGEAGDEPNDEEANEPDNEEANEPDNEEANEPDNEEANEPDNEEANEPDNEEANEPDNEEANEPDNEDANEPDNEEANEPDTEEANEPDNGALAGRKLRKKLNKHTLKFEGNFAVPKALKADLMKLKLGKKKRAAMAKGLGNLLLRKAKFVPTRSMNRNRVKRG